MMKRLTLTCVTLLTCGTMAQAEISVTGFLQFDQETARIRDFTEWFSPYKELRGDLALAYSHDQFTVAAGVIWDQEVDSGEPLIAWDEDRYYLVGYGPVTLSYGSFYGAGNMLSEDYFLMDDASSHNFDTLRLDYAAERFHLALSRDISDSDEWELGLSTKLFDHFVRVGFEGESQDLGVIFGRDMGGWGYHIATLQDLDDNDPEDDQLAGTLLFDPSDSLRLAAHLNFDSNSGDLIQYGLALWYEIDPRTSALGPVTLMAQFGHEVDWDFDLFRFGIDIPFGKPLPAAYERRDRKEYVSGYGFY